MENMSPGLWLLHLSLLLQQQTTHKRAQLSPHPNAYTQFIIMCFQREPAIWQERRSKVRIVSISGTWLKSHSWMRRKMRLSASLPSARLWLWVFRGMDVTFRPSRCKSAMYLNPLCTVFPSKHSAFFEMWNAGFHSNEGNSLCQQFVLVPSLLHYDKASSIKKWLSQFVVEELECPDPTSVSDLTSTLEAEWEMIPATRFQHLVESLQPEKWRLL